MLIAVVGDVLKFDPLICLVNDLLSSTGLNDEEEWIGYLVPWERMPLFKGCLWFFLKWVFKFSTWTKESNEGWDSQICHAQD